MQAYILNLADLFLTLHALSHGGVELNPLMQSLPVMVAWKVVGCGVLCGVLEYYARPPQSAALTAPPRGRRVARWGLRLCACAYALACINNMIFIFGGAI